MRKRLLIGSALALALAAVAILGLVRVRPGEVAIDPRPGDAAPRVWQEGWHWRAPFTGPLQRFPRQPIQVATHLELETSAGERLVLRLAGAFGLEEGREGDWVRASGGAPFVDGIVEIVSPALAPVLADLDALELFLPALRDRLGLAASEALSRGGVTAESLSVDLPAEANAELAEGIRRELAARAAPSGRKLLVVGWDGADWLMIRPLLEQGRLPNLARLVERGASGELRSNKPLLSPLVWTTIATGKPVLEHGIADFLVQNTETGGMVPISSRSRKVHAIWTLLEPFELRADVVGWWATWPAEPIPGTMVTDRVAYQLFDIEESGEVEGKVHPESAWSWIKEELVSAEEIGWAEVRRFVEVGRDEMERLWGSLPPERRQEEKVNHLRKILAATRSYHGITLKLLEEQADLTLAYYEGTDTVGHLFGRYVPPKMEGVTDEEVRRYGEALAEYYVYADELLGELLAAAEPETTVLLISDHGFFTGAARPTSDPADFAEGAPQWHRLYGVMVAGGPGIRRGRIENASIFDVAPTVLSLLGLPVPADMPGRVIDAARSEQEPSETRLASYEILPRRQSTAVQRDAGLDRERMRELAALGYISASKAEGSAASGGERSTPGQDLEGIVTEAYNKGRIHQNRGEYADARREYRLAIQRMPGFGPAYASLAQLSAIAGDHCQAFDILRGGFSRSGNLPMAAVTGLVDEAKACGNLEEAEQALEGLPSVYREKSAYFAAFGLLHEALGRIDEALAAYAEALDVDPLDQLANEQTVALLRKEGREAEARSFLREAFAKADGQLASMNQLSVVALRQGWPAEAEPMLRRVLESDPGNPGVLANLAACLVQLGRRGEALEAMTEAVERDPDNARNHFNLGAMLADEGRISDAARAFEAAAAKGLRAPRVYIAAAKMYFRLGDRQATRRALEQALEVEPGNAEATRLLEVLDRG